MKKRLSILIVLLGVLSLLSACEDKSLAKLTGESEHWKGKLVMTKPFKKEISGTIAYSEYELFVTYRGMVKKLDGVNTLEYGYATDSMGMSTELRFPDVPDDLTFSLKGKETDQNAIDKDDTVTVLVRWDGQEETFTVE